MHAELRENLEDLLSGSLGPARRRAVEAHLSRCADCRRDWDDCRHWAGEIRSLRPPDGVPYPTPGFYARLAARIEDEREIPFWALLLDSSFGRKVLLANLILLALLGVATALQPEDYQSRHRPEAMLVDRSVPAPHGGSTLRWGRKLEDNRNAALAFLITDREEEQR